MEPALRTHADKNRQYGGYLQICLEQCLKLKQYIQFVQKAHFIYNNTPSPTTTLFPGSLILQPRASEERPWLGLVTCYFDNWEQRGGVLCNWAVCRVELCRAATALRAEISNSIYSDVYLKVRQGCLEIFYLGRDVVDVIPIEYLWRVGYISTVDVNQCNFILKW